MAEENSQPTFIFRSYVNSFAYLYQDASYLHEISKKPAVAKSFERVQLCRTALLVYVFSLEGLINRALDFFTPAHLREFVLKREDRLGIEDKWQLLPLVVSEKETFDISKYPWSHFSELVSIRNDFVHPKHDRPAYYKAVSSHDWKPLSWKEIPKDLSIREKDVIYRQTQIPKDPYAIRPEHIDKVKKVVDDTVMELDRLLGGKITQNDWLHKDEMKLIYPPNAKLDDLSVLSKKKTG